MPSLGTRRRPVFAQVQTDDEAEVVIGECISRGWDVVVVVDPEEQRDLRDLDWLLGRQLRREERQAALKSRRRPPMNAACPCGSGRKHKRCCGRAWLPAARVGTGRVPAA
jgi:hypothetical protein